MSKSTQDFTPDQGWAWLILTASFFIDLLIGGMLFSFGVFFLELLDYFQESRYLTAWIGSIAIGIFSITAPLASIICSKFGHRVTTICGSLLSSAGIFVSIFAPNIWVMMISYSLVGGVGCGLSYFSGFVEISHYFKKWRSLAVGIAVSGAAVGTFLFAPFYLTMIRIYTWKGALIIMSGIMLNICVLGALYRPPPPPKGGKQGKNTKKLFDLTVLKEPACLLICLSTFFNMLGFYVPLMFLPDLTQSVGLGKEKGVLLLSIIGIINAISRITAGALTSLLSIDPLRPYYVALIVGGIATLFVPWFPVFPFLCCYAVMFAICFGANISFAQIIQQEFISLDKLPYSFGFFNLACGIAAFISAPLAGFIYDMTGTHMWTFTLAGVLITFAGILTIPMRCLHNRYHNQDDNLEEDPKTVRHCDSL